MLTKLDVQRILSQMPNELNASSRTVVVCALMLLLLFGVACLGAAHEVNPTLVYK